MTKSRESGLVRTRWHRKEDRKRRKGQVWWCAPVLLAFERLKEEGREFEAILGCIVRSYLKFKKQKEKKRSVMMDTHCWKFRDIPWGWRRQSLTLAVPLRISGTEVMRSCHLHMPSLYYWLIFWWLLSTILFLSFQVVSSWKCPFGSLSPCDRLNS